jgi:hypothetical protein
VEVGGLFRRVRALLDHEGQEQTHLGGWELTDGSWNVLDQDADGLWFVNVGAQCSAPSPVTVTALRQTG